MDANDPSYMQQLMDLAKTMYENIVADRDFRPPVERDNAAFQSKRLTSYKRPKYSYGGAKPTFNDTGQPVKGSGRYLETDRFG